MSEAQLTNSIGIDGPRNTGFETQKGFRPNFCTCVDKHRFTGHASTSMDATLHQHLRAQERPVILLEGTRKLPAGAHGQLQALTAWLCAAFPRAIFRSGNAEGTDAVFAVAVAACDPARLELVLPHAGMGRKRRPVGARCVALEAMPDADLERVVAVNRQAGRDAGRLGEYYLTHRHGPSSAATSKATYLLRDTLKVTGAEALGLSPASLGIFFVNDADPTGGGTGHTIRVCAAQGVPAITQTEWGSWERVAGES